MKPYLVKTPKIVQRIFPKRIWSVQNSKKTVYLTFDDGPIPDVTPWVLEELKKYNFKATFFCIGNNITKHPDIFRPIISEGHAIGNHTYNHLNGWETNSEDYISDCDKFHKILNKIESDSLKIGNKKIKIKNLFRPPYGKITSSQSKSLQKKGYKIIMWDVLSADFDASISEEKCLQNVLKNIEEGSIIVFHDSLKAEKNLRYTLPKVLKYIHEKGWKSKALNGF